MGGRRKSGGAKAPSTPKPQTAAPPAPTAPTPVRTTQKQQMATIAQFKDGT